MLVREQSLPLVWNEGRVGTNREPLSPRAVYIYELFIHFIFVRLVYQVQIETHVIA